MPKKLRWLPASRDSRCGIEKPRGSRSRPPRSGASITGLTPARHDHLAVAIERCGRPATIASIPVTMWNRLRIPRT
jgi:hypothetical protein